MTPPILVIQTIKTVWGKAARGGELARLRNAVPQVLPLPLQRSTHTLSNFQHHAQFLEHVRWRTPEERILFDTLVHPITVGCVTIEQGSDRLWVTYQYRRESGGAPDRHNERKTLVSEVQHWIQVLWNGRFSPAWEGDWWYEKTVVNVGLFETFTPKLFTSSSPSASYQSLPQIRSYPSQQ
jgi:hypothetical protein